MASLIQRITTISFLLLFSTVTLSAEEMVIPNKFEPGKKAVAAEVNENFTAVKTAVDNNSADIDDNSGEISTNKTAISANETKINNTESAISDNTIDIGRNAAAITENSDDIAENTSGIQLNTDNIADNDIDIADLYRRLSILENCARGRFCDMENGTVRDNKTGLVWMKDAGLNLTRNWSDATNYVAFLKSGVAGLTDGSSPGDWRLPTRTEWQNFIVTDKGYSPPMCNTAGTGAWVTGDIFTGISASSYWSGTESNATEVYIFLMTDGTEDLRLKTGGSGFARIWAVRDKAGF